MAIISIIVPVYNVEKYLDEFINSLLSQTFKEFKVFLVDDCSTDSSFDILKNYSKKHPEKFVLKRNSTNLGLSGTRNVGLITAEEEESEYTTFLDPDDWIDENYFKMLYSQAKEYDADICISGMVRFEDKTNNIICTEMVNFPSEPITKPWCYDGFSYINPSVCNKIFKSEMVRGLRFRTIKRSEDTCYFFEALPKSKTIKFTNVPGYHYRIHNKSLSGAIGQDKLDSMYEGFSEIYPEFKTNPYSLYKDAFETQIYIRVALGGVCRVAFSDIKNAKRNINKTYSYMNDLMPDWKENKYLSFGHGHVSGKKPQMIRISALFYKLHIFYLFVQIYYMYSQKLKKDIRL